MRVICTLPAENPRRYGKTWLAKVVAWDVGKPPALEFGANIDRDTAEVDAQPEAVVRYGRKDHRGNGTTSEIGIVQSDGTIKRSTPAVARNHYLALKIPLPTGTED